jgi:tRNA1Val (adenine37-N6)-methyltransferase
MILKDNEKIEDLQLKGLKIIQNKKWFCFGMDSVLLSDFVDLKKNSTVVDLGTGTGIIPLLLWGKKEPEKIYGIEIQEEVAEMAKRSVALNNLDEKIEILNIDMKEVGEHIKNYSVDAVVTNPPYVESNGGLVNPEDKKALSRHEISCSLDDVIRTSARLLRDNGRFYMVHRPYRIADIIELMRKYKLEPKKMRLVYPRQGKNPNMILIKGVKGGNPEMKIESPLYVYKDKENYTDEIYEIYGMERKDGR